MLLGKPLNRCPTRALIPVASKPFQIGYPPNAVSMHALFGVGSTAPAKLSGKPAVKVTVGFTVRADFTMTLKLQHAKSRQALVTQQTTTFVPIGKVLPDGGVHVIVDGGPFAVTL